MAGETEWFLRMFHNNAISQDMRRAWALDSLAMGPHGAWIEPEVLEESLAGYSPKDGQADVAASLWAMVWSTNAENTMHAAAILQGLRELEDPLRPIEPRFDNPSKVMAPYAHVLHPLWARSGEAIVRAISDSEEFEWRRVSVLSKRLTPAAFMRAIDQMMNYEIADELGVVASYMPFEEAAQRGDDTEEGLDIASELLYQIRAEGFEFADLIQQRVRDLFVMEFRKQVLREKGV